MVVDFLVGSFIAIGISGRGSDFPIVVGMVDYSYVGKRYGISYLYTVCVAVDFYAIYIIYYVAILDVFARVYVSCA
jgi:hypothetical protein